LSGRFDADGVRLFPGRRARLYRLHCVMESKRSTCIGGRAGVPVLKLGHDIGRERGGKLSTFRFPL
jgi:hypothetical protein